MLRKSACAGNLDCRIWLFGSRFQRWLRFCAVGTLGFIVQLGAFLLLSAATAAPYGVATLIAVEAAILHNFCWHDRWTWRDRPTRSSRLARLLAFHANVGIISLAGNAAIVLACVEAAGMSPALANVVAVGLCSIATFTAGDGVVWK
jgi:putative flippase GtrA